MHRTSQVEDALLFAVNSWSTGAKDGKLGRSDGQHASGGEEDGGAADRITTPGVLMDAMVIMIIMSTAADAIVLKA